MNHKNKSKAMIVIILAFFLAIGASANGAFAISATNHSELTKNTASNRVMHEGEMGDNTKSKINFEDEQRTPGSREDYNSILTLMTPDYKNQSVADFNTFLLKWANENEEIHDRIIEDLAKNDIRVSLTDEELSFLNLSVVISNAQNTVLVRNENNSKQKADLKLQYCLTTDSDPYLWLRYQLVVKISNENKLSIGERDKYLSNIINGMQASWSEKDIDELITTDEKVFKEKLALLAAKNSNHFIKIEISNFYFNNMANGC